MLRLQGVPCVHHSKSRKGTDAYKKFVNLIRYSLECSINHDGSAGSIEAKGIV